MDNRDDDELPDWAKLANAIETSRVNFQNFQERLVTEHSKAARWSMWAAIASAFAAGILAIATLYQVWQGGPNIQVFPAPPPAVTSNETQS